MKKYKVFFKVNDKDTLRPVELTDLEEAKILASDYLNKIISEWEEGNPSMLSERQVFDNIEKDGTYFEGFIFMRASDGKRGYFETSIEEI
jgi:hypothetical protein